MKQAIVFIFIGVFFLSCKDTWNEDDKTAFKQTCLSDAKAWAGTDAKAETYCNCVMDKILAKYPHENDALEHLDSIIKDPELLHCRAVIGK